jgi:hypothetical protein
MFALVYASTGNQTFDEEALNLLSKQAAEKNRRLDVTGYLNFSRGVFFQYLEGEKKPVVDLMDVIQRDGRHRVTNLVSLGEVGERLFPEWRMRYLSTSQMRTVRMEDVLENVLLTMKAPAYAEDAVKEAAIRLVRKLSLVRAQLPLAG